MPPLDADNEVMLKIPGAPPARLPGKSVAQPVAQPIAKSVSSPLRPEVGFVPAMISPRRNAIVGVSRTRGRSLKEAKRVRARQSATDQVDKAERR